MVSQFIPNGSIGITDNLEGKNKQEQRQMRGFFASLRMTAKANNRNRRNDGNSGSSACGEG
jgi:hypothetical protein